MGHFLLGTIYYSICNQYRTDRYSDLAMAHLDTAIQLAQDEVSAKPNDPDSYFILGSAYGYRASFRGQHCAWWGAVRDGGRSASNLSKALALDSSMYDAYLGLGAYHYWKSAKCKNFAWLPFISDRRAQGVSEVQTAGRLGCISRIAALRSLSVIYLNESRWADAKDLADSVLGATPGDAGSLMHVARASVETRRWDEAEAAIRALRQSWNDGAYSDPCGITEADYLEARTRWGSGDKAGALKLVNSILTASDSCGGNSFYDQTRDNTEALMSQLKSKAK
jgi:tetratricopeptide (TPR) repeat protein